MRVQVVLVLSLFLVGLSTCSDCNINVDMAKGLVTSTTNISNCGGVFKFPSNYTTCQTLANDHFKISWSASTHTLNIDSINHNGSGASCTISCD
eukprot:TRINITY_DN9577_c0_g1_i1.p1 TRINITY_DN9577_c0_g1~~TRINITY_DN9577_c0_g1_i1.p1  ORF type:complete len:102 (-),score=9.78 TRINITY_DN9577_c0_g1_i1:77-358(-)